MRKIRGKFLRCWLGFHVWYLHTVSTEPAAYFRCCLCGKRARGW